MIQRSVSHLPGRFIAHINCGREPLHIEARGRMSGEPVAFAAGGSLRHRLECPGCKVATGWHTSLDVATHEWNRDHATNANGCGRKRRTDRRSVA